MPEHNNPKILKKILEFFLLRQAILFALFSIFFIALVSIALLGEPQLAKTETQPPTSFTYQGKLLQSDSAVTTTKSMSFVLYDASTGGNVLYTASGSTSTPTSTALSISPSDGIFSVDIGDGSTNAIPDYIFQNNATIYLEVWIDGTQMSPRKKLVSTPFALNSQYLMGFSATSTALTQAYIPVANDSGYFNFTRLGINSSSPLYDLAVNGTSYFGDAATFGATTTLNATTTINGAATFNNEVTFNATTTFSSPIVTTATSTLVTTTVNNTLTVDGIADLKGYANNPQPLGKVLVNDSVGTAESVEDFAVEGDFVYVLSDTDQVQIVDMSNPESPSIVTTFSDASITNPNGIDVQGDYLYIADAGIDGLQIVDVSDPTNPSLLGSNGAFQDFNILIQDAHDVVVDGNYAYLISNGSTGGLEIMDISNPLEPKHVGSYFSGGAGGLVIQGSDVYIEGNYAYVLDVSSDELQIIDISDKTSPESVGSIDTLDGPEEMDNPLEIIVKNGYAYIVSSVSDALEIIDVTDPSAPTHTAFVADGGDFTMSGAKALDVAGDYAYVASTDGGASGSQGGLQIIDISDPTSPSAAGFLASQDGSVTCPFLQPTAADPYFEDPQGLIIHGGILITVSEFSEAANCPPVITQAYNYVQLLDVSGANISNTNIGSAKIDKLRVSESSEFANKVYIKGGLNVGGSGLLVQGDIGFSSYVTSSAAQNTLRFSHSGLFVSSATSTESNIFIFDTENSYSTSNSSTYLLSVRNNGSPAFSVASNGDVAASGTLFAESATVGVGDPGDIAEYVPVIGTAEAGDVLVVADNKIDTYTRSMTPCDSRVSGVVSTKPSLVIGGANTGNSKLMAMNGRVPLNVSDEGGAIAAGDLLVTASEPGHAMKLNPSMDCGDGAVAVIGIALEAHESGEGKIMALVQTGWVQNTRQTVAELQRRLIARAEDGTVEVNIREMRSFENRDGYLLLRNKDLNLGGNNLLNVGRITGTGWEIDENGLVVHKQTSEGDVALYPVLSKERQLTFDGSAQLEDGKYTYEFDDIIKDLIDVSDYYVGLSLTSKSDHILYVEKESDGFTVKGGEDETFDWMVTAVIPTDKELPEAMKAIEEENNDDASSDVRDNASSKDNLDERDTTLDSSVDDTESQADTADELQTPSSTSSQEAEQTTSTEEIVEDVVIEEEPIVDSDQNSEDITEDPVVQPSENDEIQDEPAPVAEDPAPQEPADQPIEEPQVNPVEEVVEPPPEDSAPAEEPIEEPAPVPADTAVEESAV